MYSNQPTNATFVSTRKKIGLLEKQKRELTVSLSMFEYEIKRLKIKNRKLDEENRRLNGDLANQSAHFVQDKRQLISDVQVSERNRYRNNEGMLKEQLQMLNQKIEEQDALLKKQYKNNYVLSLKLNVAQADLSKSRKSVEKYKRKYEKEVNEKSTVSNQIEEYRNQITSLYDEKDSEEKVIRNNLESAKKRILELERGKRFDEQTYERIKHELEEKIKLISHEKEVVQEQAKRLQKDHQEAVLQQVRLKREITDVQHSKSHLRTSLHQTMHKLKIANHEIRKLKNTTPSSTSFSNPKSSPLLNRSKQNLMMDPTSTPTSNKISSQSSQTPPTTRDTLLVSESPNDSKDLEKLQEESQAKMKKLQQKVEETEKSSNGLLRKYNELRTSMNKKSQEIEDSNRQMKNVMYKNYCLQQKLNYQQKRHFKQYDLEELKSQFLSTKNQLSKVTKQYQLARVKNEKLKSSVRQLLGDKKKWSDQKVTIRSELEREKYINQILRLKKVDNLLHKDDEDDVVIDKENYLYSTSSKKNKSPFEKKRKYEPSSLISISSGSSLEEGGGGRDVLGYDFQMLDSNFTLSKQQLLKERDDLREVVKKLMSEAFKLKQVVMKKNSELEDNQDLVKEVNLKNSNFERKCKMLMTKLKETLDANQMWKVKFSEIHQNMIRLKKILAKKNIDLEKILNHFNSKNNNNTNRKINNDEEEVEGEEEEEDNNNSNNNNKEEEEEEREEKEKEENGENGGEEGEENGPNDNDDTREVVREKMERKKARINKKKNDLMRRKVIVLESSLKNSDSKNKKMMQSIQQLKKMVFKE